MATILAANTGNWSATGTWTGGVVPVAGDIVVANGKTITMDTLTITVAELRNDTTGGAVAGGSFTAINGNNVTANIYAGSSSASCISWAGAIGQTITITGNFYGGTYSAGINGAAILCSGGNLTIGGGSQTTGGTVGAQASGIQFSSSGTLVFGTAGNPGVITGGTSSSSNATGIRCDASNSNITIYATTIAANTSGFGNAISLTGSTQTVNIITTNIGTATSTGSSINTNGASANHTYTISGIVTGGTGSSSYGIVVQNTGTYNITLAGNITGGPGTACPGLVSNNAATINITGNIINNAATAIQTNYSIWNNGTGTINITGSVTAGSAQLAMLNGSTGVVRCTRAIGNGFGVGSVGISNVAAVVSNVSGALTYVEQLQFGSLGNTPVSGPIRLTANTGNVVQFTTTTGTTKTLVDTAAISGVLPAATDVRTGVVYSSGNLTGSCAVPAAGSVALGVAVDNTTGTAVLTAANVRTAVGMASANLDTQLSGISSTVSALPSAASIATAVWAAATRTLTTAIDNSATIAAAVWGYATGRTITGGTVDTLTNSPDVPTEAEIAAQVRTELSSELARVANCATVATTGQQIEDALN